MAARATHDPTHTRTVALIGHRGSGKTTLAENILALTGAVRRPGRVDDGTALLDHTPAERRRRQSLRTSVAWVEWGDELLQLIDTPGLDALAYERMLAIATAEVVVIVVDGGDSLPATAEAALSECTARGVPTIVFVNKVDRPHELGAILEDLERSSGTPVVPVQSVVGEGGQCTGIIDLLSREPEMIEGCEPLSEVQPWMTRSTERLSEAVSLTDDALLEHYLEYFEIPVERLRGGLSTAVRTGKLVPVLFGSAASGFGVRRLLEFVVASTPSAASRTGPTAFEYDGTPVAVGSDDRPVLQLLATQHDADGAPFHVLRVWQGVARLNQVWTNAETGESAKIRKLYRLRGPRRATARGLGPGALLATWDPLPGRPGACFNPGEKLWVPAPQVPPSMMSYALKPTSARDADRLADGVRRLLAVDSSLQCQVDETTGRLLLRGVSESHLDLAIERLSDPIGVQVCGELPPIPYRETPVGLVQGISGVHRKEDGDGLAVEFGACEVEVAPASPEVGVGFEDRFPDLEELPRKFRPAIDEGVRGALRHGPTAGYPVLGANITLTGGEYDILQSTEDHFRRAGEIAARTALQRAGTRILEPWWQVDVYVRGDQIGHVIAEISTRRGRIVGLEVLGHETRLCAQVPYRDLRTFGPRLQGVTAGRGRFYGDFSHYEPAPDHVGSEAIADSPFSRAS